MEQRTPRPGRKRLLIVTDSTCMPRPGLPYEKTFIGLLKERFPDLDIIDRSARGTVSFRLVSEGGGGIDLLETYEPDTVILQVGMNDCAPRLFKKPGLEFFIVSRVLPARLRDRYLAHVKRTRTRSPEVTTITPAQFASFMTSYLERALRINSRVIIIPIAPPPRIFLAKSPHAGFNISRYNDIMRNIASGFPHVTVADPYAGISDIDPYMIDEVHVNEAGATLLFEELQKIVVKEVLS